MTDVFVDHDGLAFRCRVEGPEGAPWMVFSNSLATDLTLWDAQVAAFGGRFRTLRYDQRGHGGTSVPHGPTTMAQLAEDAAALMAHFAVRDAVFVGVSMGAATGLCLAPRAPGVIARLVAADGGPATPPGGAQAWAERIDYATAHGMEAFAGITVRRWFAPAAMEDGNPGVALAHAMVARTPLAGLIACVRALQDYDVRPGLAAITQPTLLVAGEADGMLPQVLQGVAPSMPNASFVAIAGAGHLPGLEKPEAFNAAMADFLR